ncbi:MAG: hypothetical protein MJZ74_02795 [Muribaculaceae bacterium]|nr:hypothetical protein [Muribaculaceae bacterium]
MVGVLGAKLRTSPRLLAWRFNTLQVYDLPGISDAFRPTVITCYCTAIV